MKKKYAIYSDTHFNFGLPWNLHNFASNLKYENPSGIIITGDVACGLTIKRTLAFLAKKLENIPIYFIVGNHDYYGSSFEEINKTINELCEIHKNLIWVTNSEPIKLKEDVCLIGEESWYDGRLGNSKYLAYNFDWLMIKEFSKLNNFNQKFELGQHLADLATSKIKSKIEKALLNFNTIYCMSHVPPWADATRFIGTCVEDFWLPYNVNYGMGNMIESIMKDNPNKNVTVLSGHTHVPAVIHVDNNINCFVQCGKYIGTPNDHNSLFI